MTSSAHNAETAAPLPPPRVPDHELLRRIGRGAYGEVWLARSVTGAFRAVKVVHRLSFDHDRPFEREFEGIRKFEPVSRRHDSQVDVLHVGRGEDCFYYVMELADDQATGGQIDPDAYAPRTLKSELQFHARLPFEECVRIGVALATALEHLHAHGLVHRDVKPSNIIFVNGVPKLADIGLVTGVDATRSHVGTEGFAAPEGPGSPQADLYSLGKVLYELATGKDRHEFPELPTQLRELPDREGLMELNAVMAKACRHDPKDRYVSATAMRADLELLQSGKSLARLHRTQERLRFVQRSGAVAAALAALIAAGWLWQARQTRVVRELVREKTRLAEANAQMANESQQRLVRLALANGARLLEKGDATAALLWFGDALLLATNSPAGESIHRIRIQQMLGQTPRLLRVFVHEQGVLSGAFSPDGHRLATGTGGSWRIWDADSGALLLERFDPGLRVQDLRYTRDGTRLLLSSCASESHALSYQSSGFAAVLEAAHGREVFPTITNMGPAAFSPDDRWLAVARTNHVVELLDLTTGRRVAEFSGHTDSILQLSFSRDGCRLASASRDRSVRIWRVPSGELVGPPIHHVQTLIRAAFSPDGQRVATRTMTGGGETHYVQTWWIASGAEIGAPIQSSPLPNPLTFDPATGRRLFTGALPPEVKMWDADSHTFLGSLPRVTTVPRCWAFSPDGGRFALGSDGGTAFIWDVETGGMIGPSLPHHGSVESVQFSPDGSRLLTVSVDGTAKLWDLATLPEAAKPLQLSGGVLPVQPDDFPHAVSSDGRKLLLPLDGGALDRVNLEALVREGDPLPWPEGEPPTRIQFDTSGQQWAVASQGDLPPDRSSGIRVWRQERDGIRALLLPHPQPVEVFQFSPDGARIFTVGPDGFLRVWRTSDGSLSAQVRMPDGCVLPLAVNPEGNRAVFADEAGELVLVDVRNPAAVGLRLPGAAQELRVCFSPDGTRLATVGNRQRGHVWDAETGQLLATFRHGQTPNHTRMWVEWSPDGRTLVTCGTGEVALWDAATGNPLFAPMIHPLAVRTAHFSPDGRFLVTVGDDSTAQVWDTARAEPVTGPVELQTPKLRAAMITTDNRLVTIGDPAVIRIRELPETHLPADVLNDYARWLAGRKLDSAGVLRDLDDGELRRLDSRLRASNPELLTTSPATLREWHRRQVQEPTSLTRVATALFHLDRLAELSPGDSWIQEQQARYRACRIPPRSADTPAHLVDLSASYTHSFEVLPHREFAGLPRGVHTLAGTPFDLRGIIRLEPRVSEFTIASFPVMALSRIPVGGRCRELHFLQGVDGEDGRDGDEVARWVIHYADGSTREWPMVYGRQVRDWWLRADAPRETAEAVVAWEDPSPRTRMAGVQAIRLFKATWANPLPGVEISHLDFVLAKANVRPFVVAITAE